MNDQNSSPASKCLSAPCEVLTYETTHGTEMTSFVDQVAAHLDLKSDKLVRVHFNAWLDQKNKQQKAPPVQNVIIAVKTPAALEALAMSEAKEIELMVELSRHRLLKRKATLVVDENEEIDPNVEWDLEIVCTGEPGQLQPVLVKSAKTLEKEARHRLFELSQQMLEAEDAQLQLLRDGHFSPEFEEVITILGGDWEEFPTDLAELLLEHGEEARRIAKSVCTNKAAAQRVMKDDKKALPLRALAQMAKDEMEA